MTQDDRDYLLLNPKPGSAAARARDYGVDLSLTLSNLRLTPQQRLERLERARELLKEFEKSEPAQEKFMPITFKTHWDVVRQIDKAMNVSYACK